MSGSVQDVVSGMSNQYHDATLGWDVVVNYSESALNDTLRDNYHNDTSHILKDFSVSITSVDMDGDDYTVTFDLQLGAPLVKFNGEGLKSTCQLTVPVNGGTSATDDQTLPIPSGGYQLVMSNLAMGTVSGSSGVVPSDKPFVFSPWDSSSAFVTIDFPKSDDTTFELVNIDSSRINRQVEAHKNDIAQRLKDWIKDNVTSVQYEMATVNPASPPGGYVALRPQSFRLATYSSSRYSTTILSLLIQTESYDSDRYDSDDLQSRWSGLWIEDFGVPPIPDSYTASIIFNSKMMHKSVIRPALQASGADADEPWYEEDMGHHYTIRTHKTVSRGYDGRNPSTTAFSVDLDRDDNALKVLIGQMGTFWRSATGSANWAFQYDFDWTYTHTSVSPGGGTYDWDEVQHVTVKNNLEKSGSFTGTLTNGTLSLDLDIRTSDWDRPDVKMQSESTWSKIFGSSPEDAPDWIRNSLPETPSLKLNMGNMYFLLTTNLLLPGNNVINVDTNQGLMIPRDFYVVGNVGSQNFSDNNGGGDDGGIHLDPDDGPGNNPGDEGWDGPGGDVGPPPIW